MDTAKLADWGTFLIGVVTAVSVVAAAITYIRAESRKRKEFMASEYRRFRDTPAVKKVMLLLDSDWGGTKLVIKGKEISQLDYRELVNALRIDEPTMQFEPWEWEVRTYFDGFLEDLVTFAQFVRCGLVKCRDLRPYLGYWLDMICGKSWMDQASAEQLWAYIDSYGFADVRWLTTKMGFSPPRERPPRTHTTNQSCESVNGITPAARSVDEDRGKA